MQCSLFFTSRLMIDSTMCCPPGCCSSQPLSGGVANTQARERLAAPQQQGAELGCYGGVHRVMGSAGTGALLSGGLHRTIFKRRPAFHPVCPRSLLFLPRLVLAGGCSQRTVLHLLNIRRHPLEEIQYFIIVNSIWVAQLLGKFVNAPYQHNISQWDEI